jgi:uncharacterized protein YdcH (DUF465 family)
MTYALHPKPQHCWGFIFEEVNVFEGQPQQVIDAKMKSDSFFRQLYYHHQKLDKKVIDAELGILAIDSWRLMRMKREKLLAKDQLTRMMLSSTH